MYDMFQEPKSFQNMIHTTQRNKLCYTNRNFQGYTNLNISTLYIIFNNITNIKVYCNLTF
jgi:hypothetical protein